MKRYNELAMVLSHEELKAFEPLITIKAGLIEGCSTHPIDIAQSKVGSIYRYIYNSSEGLYIVPLSFNTLDDANEFLDVLGTN